MKTVQIVGRSSSHFTRVPLIFAHETGGPFEFVPVYDMTSLDPATYAGHPALKLPTLRNAGALLFGAENIGSDAARNAYAFSRSVRFSP